MGRLYSVLMDAVSVSAAKDLLRLSAPADAVVVVHEVTVSQEASETSEQVAIQLQRASTDGTGTSATPRPMEVGSTAFGGTAVVNLTADTTPGDILRREAANLLSGYKYLPTPETRPVISPSGRFVVRLEDAPAAARTMSVEVIFEEIGG